MHAFGQILYLFCCLYCTCMFRILPEELCNYHKTRKTDYCAHENERESLACGRNSRAKAGKINKAERDIGLGALPRLLMHKFVLCIMHIYIATMQYIRNYHAAYKYTIQLGHTCLTMHCIHLVNNVTLTYMYKSLSQVFPCPLDKGDIIMHNGALS